MKITEHCGCGADITADSGNDPTVQTLAVVKEWRAEHRCTGARSNGPAGSLHTTIGFAQPDRHRRARIT